MRVFPSAPKLTNNGSSQQISHVASPEWWPDDRSERRSGDQPVEDRTGGRYRGRDVESGESGEIIKEDRELERKI